MRTLIHNSPAGELSIPGLLTPVPPGEPFDADDALAESLLSQTDLYTEVVIGQKLEDASAKDLRALAESNGIEVPARASKAKLLELLEGVEWPVLGADEELASAGDTSAESEPTDQASAADQQGDPQ